MLPVTANVPLALGSVIVRRLIDSYTGRLPLAIAAAQTVPSTSTIALFSGALFCLYHQLRKGTLVKIGVGKTISSLIKNSRHTIQRRIKNKSWFLRNVDACRRKCTEAMHKIACHSKDSIEEMPDETGVLTDTSSLPTLKHNIINQSRPYHGSSKHQHPDNPIENLYRNQSFNNRKICPRNNEYVQSKKQQPAAKALNRPITRNFVKSNIADNSGDCTTRLSPKIRKKDNDDNDKQRSRRALINREEEVTQSTIPQSKMTTRIAKQYSEKNSRLTKIQKITRKTRSGRVYAYRL
ncbi:uncharacterized protein LOC115875337 [Sitophilus oryzae]|uniref:Uncharacterized protein LOC115875337 n=1 Tax=Sitophilus oryzae TaxID=7048 RepID=A0A6J2X619_SITOR|nr:uncharacterized protein LOC115875337 [Sitophilus oryzae]